MTISRTYLFKFIAESNTIEGIHRPPSTQEIYAHAKLLMKSELIVADLENFVLAVQPGARLRRRVGMDVQVGGYIAPRGGPEIEAALEELLRGVCHDDEIRSNDPHETHHRYENLHPFTDGNGRSGRALWLWERRRWIAALEARGEVPLGFLHRFYYDTLAACR